MAELNKQVKALAKAIRMRETRGHKDPYNAKSRDGGHGAYQIQKPTWRIWAGRYLGNPDAPMTEENQNFIAYSRIKEWKDGGLNPAQIAAAWNGGEGVLKNDRWKKMRGVNDKGVRYDIPAYVDEVYNTYKTLIPKKKEPEVMAESGEENGDISNP